MTNLAKPISRTAFTAPHGAGQHLVQQGECLMSISEREGFHWQTIWDDAGNSDLKSVRGSGKVLLPGDHLTIPEKRLRAESGATEKKHSFRRRGVPARLCLRLRAEGEPLADQPYSAEIDGRTHSGTTDGEGKIDIPIPNGAVSGTLRVGSGDEQQVYHLRLGALDPYDSIGGVQSRLAHLGYLSPPLSMKWDEETHAALRQFQLSRGVTETGTPDSATLRALAESHGS